MAAVSGSVAVDEPGHQRRVDQDSTGDQLGTLHGGDQSDQRAHRVAQPDRRATAHLGHEPRRQRGVGQQGRGPALPRVSPNPARSRAITRQVGVSSGARDSQLAYEPPRPCTQTSNGPIRVAAEVDVMHRAVQVHPAALHFGQRPSDPADGVNLVACRRTGRGAVSLCVKRSATVRDSARPFTGRTWVGPPARHNLAQRGRSVTGEGGAAGGAAARGDIAWPAPKPGCPSRPTTEERPVVRVPDPGAGEPVAHPASACRTATATCGCSNRARSAARTDRTAAPPHATEPEPPAARPGRADGPGRQPPAARPGRDDPHGDELPRLRAGGRLPGALRRHDHARRHRRWRGLPAGGLRARRALRLPAAGRVLDRCRRSRRHRGGRAGPHHPAA